MSRSAFEEHYGELVRDLNALEAQLANSEMRKQFADVEQRIEVLYETLRENRLLLETVLENSAASIYAKRKDGRYTYINHEMEVLCNVAREQVLGKTDFEVFRASGSSAQRSTRSWCARKAQSSTWFCTGRAETTLHYRSS